MSLTDASDIYKKYNFLLTSEKLQVKKDIFLNELGYLADNFDDFLTSESNIICSRSNIVIKLTELIVNFGLVKTFDVQEDRVFDAKDFPTEAQDAEKCFDYLIYLLIQYGDIDASGKRKFLVQVVLLCATYSSTYLWSTEESVSSSQEVLDIVLIRTNHKSLTSLLTDETFYPTIFNEILNWMRPILMKDSWMKNPSSCYVFFWLLSHVKHPHLVDYFNIIIPPPFMFASSYAAPHQVIGIRCFNHILDNVPPSLIKSSGVEDAIFDCLKKFIYIKDIPVIEVLYPCLLKLPMMNLQKVNHLRWLEFDNVLQQLLTMIDNECDPKLRHIFLVQIHLFIKTTPCFPHLKNLLRILLQNFAANSLAEEKCRAISLKIIKDVIQSCWPRMENYCYEIMLAILKVVYDLENPSYASENIFSEEVSSLCKECSQLLKCAFPTKINNFIKEFEEDWTLSDVSLLQKDL